MNGASPVSHAAAAGLKFSAAIAVKSPAGIGSRFFGSTGDASPEAPHLHYAINAMAPGEGWWQGKPVNPYPLLLAGQ